MSLALLPALFGLLSTTASATVPTGFTDTVVISGRTNPTSVSFAPNGQIFVTEKSGEIWAYTSLSDLSPTLVADLRTQVDNYWDRGLLGLGASGTPFTVTVMVRHATSVSATSPQAVKSGTYYWQSWSDGGAASHTITAPAVATTYTATYHRK